MNKINSNPIVNNFRLIKNLNRKLKTRFILLSIIIFINSVTELLSISAIIPFLIALTNPQGFNDNLFINFFSRFIDLTNINLVLLFALIFGAFVIASAILRIITLKLTCEFCAKTTSYIASKSFKNYINQEYEFFLSNNSNDFINILTLELLRTSSSLECLFLWYSCLVLSVFIIISLLIINPQITLFIFSVIGIVYLLFAKYLNKKFLRNSEIISKTNSYLIKMLQESFGGIRETIIDNNQNYFVGLYSKEDYKLREQIEINKFYKKIPRYFIEAVGVIILITVSIFIVLIQKNENIIPVLGFIAFSFQKLLSASQQIYSAWSQIVSANTSVLAVLETLNIRSPKTYKNQLNPLKLNEKIVLDNIVYKYKNQKEPVLKGVNLTINKGEIIGIIGKTGSGKSTLLDIINGLVNPTSGNIIIDDLKIYGRKDQNKLKMWQKNIAHVPQNIFLSNDTILRNIAFGIEPNLIDNLKVYKAARDAFIFKDIESMPLKYQTFVGERGVNLSGGQLQRLGIARALYKQKDLLILDEITSSLDKNTEDEIINVLDKLSSDITILIVAHRLTTLKICDKVYELQGGKLTQKEVKKISQT